MFLLLLQNQESRTTYVYNILVVSGSNPSRDGFCSFFGETIDYAAVYMATTNCHVMYLF